MSVSWYSQLIIMVWHVNFNDVLFIGDRDSKILFDHHFKLIGLKFIFPKQNNIKSKKYNNWFRNASADGN